MLLAMGLPAEQAKRARRRANSARACSRVVVVERGLRGPAYVNINNQSEKDQKDSQKVKTLKKVKLKSH